MKRFSYFTLVFFVFTSTVFSQNKVSNTSGNWNDPTVWTPNGVPTSTNNVTIVNGHTIAINVSGVCNALTVGTSTGTGGRINFSGNTARTFSVTTDILVNNTATFNILTNSNTTHTVNIGGNLTNNGVFDLAVDGTSRAYIQFLKNGNQTVSGTGSLTDFYKITLNMGTSRSNILEITSSSFTATSNFLTLTNGTFKLSTPATTTVVPYTGTATIPVTAGYWINSPNAVVSNSAVINLSGLFSVSAGSVDIGNANNEDLASTGGTVIITGGSLDIAGKYRANTGAASTFSISGGTLIVPNVNSTNTGIAPFHMSVNGSQFNMTGGLIVLRREGGNGTQDLGFLNTGATSGAVTGGTLQLGTTTTPANQTITINASFPIANLVVASASVTAKLATNSPTISGNVTVTNGTINANNLGMTVGGNWTNAGVFIPGTGTVTFNSSSSQSILKTGGETFNAVNFAGSGLKTFASALTANGNFSIASGASVDVSASNFSLTLKRNFTNNGSFNARNGLVMMNGTVAQSIGGTSVTDFRDLSLSNTTGASLTNAENLLGTLTLSNGTFNTNGQVFTMVSTATATARVAQITGSGDITGNVTVQRFIPGGTTGWAFLGTPISSALTLNDWDDDISISCPTCPDGTAGGFLSVYSYSEQVSGVYDAAASYVPLSTINDPITSGKGYWVYMGNGQFTTTDIVMDVTGTLRKSNYTIPLNYTNSGSSADDGWNLITNPYPSAISWSALRGSTANLDDAIYVYNADLNGGTGGFASFVNGISSPAVVSGGIGNTIPMGQGFYVHSTGATGINATEANKATGNPTFLKTSSASGSNAMLRLFLKGSGSYNDETVLYFDPSASDQFDDGFDSYKMRGQDLYAPSIALEEGSEVFQINGVSPVSGNWTMPLKTLTGYSGTYTISTENISSFPAGACITLYDKFTASTIDLRNQDYVFFLSDTTTVARFDLHITILPLSISSTISQPSCSFPAIGKVKAQGLNSGPWNYYWRSNGTIIKTSLNVSGADSLSNLSSGTIDLEMNSVGGCDNHQSSFVIQPQVPVTAQFSSVDTLDMDQNTSVQFNNISVNADTYFWSFGAGQGTSTQGAPVYNYTSPGVYTVQLICTSVSGCADSASKLVTVISNPLSVLSLNENDEELLLKTESDNVYVLHQELSSELTISIRLYDITGKLVKDYGTSKTQVVEQLLDLSTYRQGIYFVELNYPGEKKTLKLLVK